MSRRQVQIVLLCEDTQHEAFVRRFLECRGWRHKPRVLKSSTGAGEQFVREHFPTELQAIRHRHVDRALIVVIDGDNRGPAGRIAQLEEATTLGSNASGTVRVMGLHSSRCVTKVCFAPRRLRR